MNSPASSSVVRRIRRGLLLFAGNLLVLAGLLLVFEGAARLGGAKTISQWRSSAGSARRLCTEGKGPLRHERAFVEDDGIVKASAEYYSSLPPGRGIPINAEGFRGTEFRFIPTRRTRILLVGDSFVWGSSAKPLDRSFADRLQGAGYVVYNAGIPGTDPQQYERIVKRYAPALKPDVVVVCLCLANDLAPLPLPLAPGRTAHFVTNFGFIRATDDRGQALASPAEAYRYHRCRSCGECDGLWPAYLTQTVSGRVVERLTHGPYPTPDFHRHWVRRSLSESQRTARRAGAGFVLCLIPGRQVAQNDRVLPFLAGMSYEMPRGLSARDYAEPPDNHFNNEGHGRYAEFLRAVLERQGYPPLRRPNPE